MLISVFDRLENIVEQDEFVKRECPFDGHIFFSNATLIFYLDLAKGCYCVVIIPHILPKYSRIFFIIFSLYFIYAVNPLLHRYSF